MRRIIIVVLSLIIFMPSPSKNVILEISGRNLSCVLFYCIGFVSNFSCPSDKYCGYIYIRTLPSPSRYSLFMIAFPSHSPNLMNRLLTIHI